MRRHALVATTLVAPPALSLLFAKEPHDDASHPDSEVVDADERLASLD